VTPVTGELAACGYKPCATQGLDIADRKQGFAKVRMDWVIKTAVFGAKVLALAGAMVVTAFSSEPIEVPYQGWVEANFVFIGPDETGRVEKLSVREGDPVAEGAPLFTVDADLQKAAVAQNAATLANARETFSRAQQLLKTGTGTKKEFDAAQASTRWGLRKP
jgi:multidrug efflux pump subunit AcrA (membrane-fusion protein)